MSGAADTPRWMRMLSRPGTLLLPVGDGRGSGAAVFPGGDRRRRPLARISPAALTEAEAQGWLRRKGEGHVLSTRASVTLRSPNDTPALHQRDLVERPVIRKSGRIETVTANAMEGALGKWSDCLAPAERTAAERFLADYHRSSLMPSVTSSWSPVRRRRGEGRTPGPDDVSVSAIAAKDRVMNALDALGPAQAQIVDAVLIREESLAAVERRFGWARRTGTGAVKMALARLAEIYRIV